MNGFVMATARAMEKIVCFWDRSIVVPYNGVMNHKRGVCNVLPAHRHADALIHEMNIVYHTSK